MEESEIVKIILEEVCFIQKLSGRKDPSRADEFLVALKECEGFDSLNGAEAAVRIGERIGCPLPTNPFVIDTHALSVQQIAKGIKKKLDVKENRK